MPSEDMLPIWEELGKRFQELEKADAPPLLLTAQNHNPWFTQNNIRQALEGIRTQFLQKPTIEDWWKTYASQAKPSETVKKVGIVMAGNIPLVGFHDLFCTLMSPHQALIKISSQDQVLMQYVVDSLIEIEPSLQDRIQVVDKLKEADAFIATGSNNTARYFEYYFGKKPNIIRQNRNSLAILNGDESDQDLARLGSDIFQYFGLGCRNVSKMLIPKDYDPTRIFPPLEPWKEIKNHAKYANNFDYHLAIYMMNQDIHYQNDFLILLEHPQYSSPSANLFYEFYQDSADLEEKIAHHREEIQVILSNQAWFTGSIDFGESQKPSLSDYADGVDTMAFLMSI